MSRFVLVIGLLLWVQFGWGQPEIHPSKVVVKIGEVARPTNARSGGKTIDPSRLTQLQYVRNATPFHTSVKPNGRIRESRFLKGIHLLELEDNDLVDAVIHELQSFSNVVYAEPIYADRLLLTPNDPAANPDGGQQYYLNLIKAYEAWDITTGSDQIIIGCVDTGAQLDHPELEGNIFLNENDPIDSIDNDANGYIDDYQGWDIADNDNDPTADGSRHGTQVAGILSAEANNGIGLAGVAFTSKFLPVKVFDTEDNRSFNTYGGVMYAADRGVKVMNLSWGSANSFSSFNQDIINYAALEKDVVIVAAAGNTNEDLDFYPASYDNVISVGASNANDEKAAFATYSKFIDVMAPGQNIYSSSNNGGFITAPGSSFASPQVAATAALVREIYPDYTAAQVAEHIRITADDMYESSTNAEYDGMLGNGRLNMIQALTKTNPIAMQMRDFDISGLLGDNIFSHDTVVIDGTLVNLINPASNISISLSSRSPYVDWVSDPVTVEQLDTNEEFTVPSGKLKAHLSSETPINERIAIQIDYEGAGFTDRQFAVFTANPTYLDLRGGDMLITIAENGNLGYEQDVFKNGKGLRVEKVIISSRTGMMIATDQNHVADNVWNVIDDNTRDQDFGGSIPLRLLTNSTADNYTEGAFEVGSGAFDMLVEQKVMGWDDLDALVIEYRIVNRSDSTLEDLKVGFFADFNLGYLIENKTKYSASRKLGLTYDDGGSNYAGTALLTSQTPGFRGIDISDFNENVPDLDEVFTDSAKFSYLNSGTAVTTAGEVGRGNYVSQLLSASVASLGPNSSTKVAFAISYAETESGLNQNVDDAKDRYLEFVNNPPLIASYEGCADGTTIITLDDGENFKFYSNLALTNLLFEGNDFEVSGVTTPRTYYVVNTDSAYDGDVKRVELNVLEPEADFDVGDLIIDEEDKGVQFLDISTSANKWLWAFDNGTFSTQQNPITQYSEPGDYKVKLTVTSATGCTSEVEKTITIIERNARPADAFIALCSGETVVFTPEDATSYHVYLQASPDSLIYAGSGFEINQDTPSRLFFTNTNGALESLPATLHITLNEISAAFQVAHDPTDLSSSTSLLFAHEAGPSTSVAWTINDQSFTDPQEFVWDGDSPIAIRFNAFNSQNGCEITVEKSLANLKTPDPTVQDTVVCEEASILLEPEGGRSFIFYAEESKEVILGKGRNLEVTLNSSDTTFYVTGVDNLLESDLVSWHVQSTGFVDGILTSPEQIILTDSRQLQLSAMSDESISWQWFINNRFFDSVREPRLLFDSAGHYSIRLISEDTDGCTSDQEINYEVFNVTSTDDLVQGVSVFPNPAHDYLRVESPSAISKVSIFDLSGKRYLEHKALSSSIQLQVSDLHPGLYFLEVVLTHDAYQRVRFLKY